MKSINIKQSLILIFIIGFLLLPLTTNAWAVEDLTSWIPSLDDITSGLINAIISLIAGLVAGIPAAALSFLNWVSGPDFLQVSMTNSGLTDADPRYNGIVGIGWEITRNLANVALIFGLVYIAINIILGSQEVQAKKSLINFVLIAILINFTPVICGVIIDASNSLTQYFLQEGVRSDLVNFLKDTLANSQGMDFAALIVFFFFGIFSAVIYLLYALLFAARYIMLWILIIVSPIAFASKVFPKSKYITMVFPSYCYWDEWWTQFIQWNVIGIPAGFFIYLSNVAMVEMAGGGMFADSSGISVFGTLFTFAMPFIFMAIGFFTTMSSGGAVGAKIGGVGKQIWGKTGGAAAGAITGAAAGAAVGAGKYVKGRAGALSTYTKEGVMGRVAGAAYNIGKKDDEKIDWHSREGRDDARQKYREFTKGVKEKAASYGVISHEAALKKSNTEKQAEEAVKNMDLDYFNKHHNDATMTSEQRKAGDIKFMKQNVSEYLKGANTDEEYQRRLNAINTYGDSSKEHKKIKTKALMDATFKNKTKAGKTDWGKLYDIKIDEEMQKLSAQDLLDNVSEDFLKDENNLGKLSAGQLNYIMTRGSKTQVDAINEVGRRYRKDKNDKKDASGKTISEGKNTIRLKKERADLETALKANKLLLKKAQTNKTPGGTVDIEKYQAEVNRIRTELNKRTTLVRLFRQD